MSDYGYYWVIQSNADGCYLGRDVRNWESDRQQARKFFDVKEAEEVDSQLFDTVIFGVRYRKGTELPKLEKLETWIAHLSAASEFFDIFKRSNSDWYAHRACSFFRAATGAK